MRYVISTKTEVTELGAIGRLVMILGFICMTGSLLGLQANRLGGPSENVMMFWLGGCIAFIIGGSLFFAGRGYVHTIERIEESKA